MVARDPNRRSGNRIETKLIRVAQHEAAHVVVGLALRLQLLRASARPAPGFRGYCEFAYSTRWQALAIMYAAGIAWEALPGGDIAVASVDRQLTQEALRRSGATRADVRSSVTCASAILHTRSDAHAVITRMLIDGDITGKHVSRIISSTPARSACKRR